MPIFAVEGSVMTFIEAFFKQLFMAFIIMAVFVGVRILTAGYTSFLDSFYAYDPLVLLASLLTYLFVGAYFRMRSNRDITL